MDESRVENSLLMHNVLLKHLHKAYESADENKFEEAIVQFQACLDHTISSFQPIETKCFYMSLNLSNISICYFKLKNFDLAEEFLHKASEALEFPKYFNNQDLRMLYLRILANFIVLKVRRRNLDEVTEVVNLIQNFIETEPDHYKRANYVMWVIRILFGTDSFIQFAENPDKRAREHLSLYSSGVLKFLVGYGYELQNNFDRASEIYFQSLEQWQHIEDNVMCLLTLNHLLNLYKDIEQTYASLKAYADNIRIEGERKNPNFGQIYEDYECRLDIVKELTQYFQTGEQQNMEINYETRQINNINQIKIIIKIGIRQSIYWASKQGISGTPTNRSFNVSKNKTANYTNLMALNKLPAPISGSQNPRARDMSEPRMGQKPFLSNVDNRNNFSPSPLSPRNQKRTLPSYYSDIIESLQKVLGMLENETSQQLINSLAMHPFIVNTKVKISLNLEVICFGTARYIFKIAFNKLYGFAKLKQRAPGKKVLTIGALQTSQLDNSDNTSAYIREQNQRGQRISNITRNHVSEAAKIFVTRGNTLIKLNYTSRGKMRKFMRVFNNTQLRWADKELYISNTNICHAKQFNEIRGIIYGARTKTFKKSSNRDLEPWLCFSIILQRRTVDFYAAEDTIDLWYIGLSEFLKPLNPSAYCLRKGKFYWRKLYFVMRFLVESKTPKKQLKKVKAEISFCKTILLYKVYFPHLI